MGNILGYLILLPFVGAILLGYKAVDVCIKKGGNMRALGILVCIIIGGGSIYAGFFIGPIVGWFIMFMGGALIVAGIWRSIALNREDLDLEEKIEKAKPFKRPGGYVACPKCGLENWEGYDECQKCGAKLIKE